MVIRIDKGVARYGLPGLILGIGLAWVSGVRGPEVAAQTGSGGPRAASSARSAEANRSRPQRPVAGGEVNGTLALITTAGPIAMALPGRHQGPRIRALPHRSHESQGDCQARGLTPVQVGPQAGTLQQSGAGARRDQGDGGDSGSCNSINGGRRRDGSRSPFPRELTTTAATGPISTARSTSMAQFYTLEEAARVLGMSAEELKTKAQSREVRAFLDGGSWRFRVVDVDELARRRGLGSDAELRLSDLEMPAGKSGSGEVQDLDLSEFQLGVAKPRPGGRIRHICPRRRPQPDDSGSDHDILLDDLALPPNQITGSSSVIIGAPSVEQAPQRLRRPARARQLEGCQRLRRPARVPRSQAAQRLRRDPDQGRHGRSRHSSAPGSSDTAVRVSPFPVRRPRSRRPCPTAISSSIPRAS